MTEDCPMCGADMVLMEDEELLGGEGYRCGCGYRAASGVSGFIFIQTGGEVRD